MKRYLFIILLSFCSQIIFAQNITDNLSIEYSDVNRKSVISKIESISKFKFYFDEKWFATDNNLLSGNHQNKTIDFILEKLFENTEINYFIDQNRIILTKNSRIYDKLAENYFENSKSTTTDVKKEPEVVFYQQYDSISKSENKLVGSVTLIGKENKDTQKKSNALSGHIINAKNNEPVADAFIKIRNTKISTISDNLGFYSIDVPNGVTTLEVSYQNFKKAVKKIIVYSDGNLDVMISEKVNVLNEVNIKRNRNNKTRTAVSGVTTLEAEGIKNIPSVFGERDILKIALTIPGIKTAGEGSSGYNVRGGKDDQNLVLLDNATLYNPAHFFGIFSAINPYTISKVDIFKGSIPSEFGGRLSSVFDITSKNGNVDKFTGEGGIGPVTSNITASLPIVKGKSSLLFGVRGTYSGWILKSLKDERLKNSKASFYDGILKYNHTINKKNTLESTLYYSNDEFKITSDSLFQYNNRLASLKWKHQFNSKHKGEVNLTNTRYEFKIDYDANNLEAFDFGYKLNETQLTLKLNYQLNDFHKFTYGISSKHYGINPGFLNPKNEGSLLNSINIDREKALESALFVSDNYKLSKKFLIDIGFRYSIFNALGASTQRIYLENAPKSDATVAEEKQYGANEVIKTYAGFEPRIAARYLFTENFSLKASYDKTFQYIHLLSSNTTQSPTDTWKLSDLNVRPQESQQFSLGLFKNIDNSDLELSIEGYYKKSKNILDYKVGANLLLDQNLETELLQGEGKSYGVEFLVKKEIGRLNGWIGYTYSRSLIKLASEFPEETINNGAFFASNFDKPHDVSVVLNYKFTKRYSFSSNFIYQTGRPITYPVGSYTIGNAEYTLYSDRNKFRIPDYYRLDIGINIEGNHKIKKLAHSFWNISIYNVLGRNNPYSVFFVTKNGEIKGYQASIFSIPVPTITYNFKF